MGGPLSITQSDIHMIRMETDANYHPKIKLTIETNPQRFLDTEIMHINGTIETRVHRKKTK